MRHFLAIAVCAGLLTLVPSGVAFGTADAEDVSLPGTWYLEDFGESWVAIQDGQMQLRVIERREGFAWHLTYAQDGRQCVASWDRELGEQGATRDPISMYVNSSQRGADGEVLLIVEQLQVDWPAGELRRLNQALDGTRRLGICW
ncbi:hypothetical protein ACFL26_00750 [Patescibacteria group bacterium]